MNKLFVLLPCYNEQMNIIALLENWQNQKDKLQSLEYEMHIICVDDGSNDDTRQIIIDMATTCSGLSLLPHERNQGLGAALKTGLKYFNENAGTNDVAVVMDADNTHSPIYIYAMLEKLLKLDRHNCCIIASRFQKGAIVKGVPGHRQFLTVGARIYYSLVLDVKDVKDYTCGYRLYTWELIHKAFEQYGKDIVTYNGFVCMMELLYKLDALNAKFAEIPFELRYDNKQGKSKMKLIKTVFESLYIAMLLRITRKKLLAKGVAK